MTNAITAVDLVLAHGASVAVPRSSFAIPRGRRSVVIGPNGSGKSTVLNGLTGLLPPMGGSVEIHGDARIAYVLQATKVNESLPVTVRELVRMGRYPSVGMFQRLGPEDTQAVQEAMEDLDIVDLAGRHLHELSGGQRQRVFLAQGLAQDHEILLLDEPLTGLDIPSARAIDRVIHDATDQGCTVVLTTHDLTSAAAADHVLLLTGSGIISGPPDEVLTSDHLRDAYDTTLMHLGDDDTPIIDDPAHLAVPGRHLHRERTIHIEASESDLHGG